MKYVASAALASILFAGVAFAASSTDIQEFEKRVGKIAPQGVGEKALCVCMNSSDFFFGAAGYLRQTREETTGLDLVVVDCFIQGYDTTSGALSYQAGCIPWAPLTK